MEEKASPHPVPRLPLVMDKRKEGPRAGRARWNMENRDPDRTLGDGEVKHPAG